MGLLLEIRSRAKHVLGTVLGICALGYAAYHSLHGDRGLFAYVSLTQKIQLVEQERRTVRARRETWEHRVRLLHPDSIDPDMLDERARLMLGYAKADEIVILETQWRTP